MNANSNGGAFTSTTRKHLFLEMARRAEGAAPPEVHQRAITEGDTVTEETYYNIARLLYQRGLLRKDDSARPARYFANPAVEQKWLDEEDLLSMLDPDYPLLALTIANETARQVNEVSEEIWFELRERLRGQSARMLFKNAIVGYCEIFAAQIGMLADPAIANSNERPRTEQEAENTRRLLLQLTKYGLGLSQEAVDLPAEVNDAVGRHKREAGGLRLVNEEILTTELVRRVADEPFVVDAHQDNSAKTMLIAGVDGSTRGGILSFLGEDGDFVAGHAPLISINTSVGQVNRLRRAGDREFPVFMRLPEKPEDMQRADNRFTVMAKLLHPDMSDAQYMHSVWNAMDMVEAKAALRLLRRWETGKPSLEVPAADVVLRDGTVSPQDRDFTHYCDLSTYGKIVRELIETNWEIAKKCREDGHTIAGVVKTTELRVYGPVLNWYAAQVGLGADGQIGAWPMQEMNLIPDQLLLTRLLTAKRRNKDAWARSCVVVRPFHALTNFARSYSRKSSPPSAPVLEAHQNAIANEDPLNQDRQHFWKELFRGENDPFVKMLDQVGYASFFVGAVPRLDTEKRLPRIEFVVTGSNVETDDPLWSGIIGHRDRLVQALQQNGFDVSAEHTMFDHPAKLDVLPSILIQVHDTVKHWAADLLSRVQEYIGAHIARFIKSKRARGVKVRPLKPDELRLLYEAMKRERELMAGAGHEPPAIEK